MEKFGTLDLSSPNLELDLTTDRWNLSQGQVSILKGVDVTRIGTIRPLPPRYSLGVSLDSADLPLTAAFEISMYGRTAKRISDVYDGSGKYTITDTSITKTTDEYTNTGKWPTNIVGAYIVKNGDGRRLRTERRKITTLDMSASENDRISWDRDWDTSMTTDDKWSIVFSSTYDKRGIWVTNGRKFWMLRGGTYFLMMDLGSDDYLGEEWRVGQIANNRVMLTSNKFAPRVLHLNYSGTSTPTTDATLAGLVVPVKPPEIETQIEGDSQEAKSWLMKISSSNGFLDPGDYRVLVRGVNYEDGLESEFVPVYSQTDPDSRSLTAVQDDAITVYMEDAPPTGAEYDSYVPPLHERMTHVEVWRTVADGAAYYLESAIELVKRAGNEDTAGSPSVVDETPKLSPEGYPIRLSDSEALGLTPLSTADIASGGLPPVCKQAVGLQGVTLCFGKADDPSKTETIDSVFLHTVGGSQNGDVYTKTGAFADYVFQSGDKLEIIGPSARRGVFDIVARTSDDALEIDGGLGAGAATVDAAIRRPYAIEYQEIESDEDCWYSRTDKFAPESFPSRTLRISDIGDTFKFAVSVLNNVAVIMRSGVHLIYLNGTSLEKETISNNADGTPWEYSVVNLGNLVIWATPEGPKAMRVSNAPNDQGSRATIQPMPGAERVREWFDEAYQLDYRVDAGVDTTNNLVVFRRKVSAYVFESLVFCYRTGKWTQVDDWSGDWLVSALAVENTSTADARGKQLYSVGATYGDVFRCRADDDEDAYSGSTVGDVLDGTYTIATTSIQKTGIFTADMLGDTVRIYTDDGVTHVRTILTATANRITFAAVSGLAEGDRFAIGQNRFRIRWAPFRGALKRNIVRVDGVMVRALPGDRHASGGVWSADTPAALGFRTIRNYVTESEAGNNTEGTVEVFDDTSVAKTSEDRWLADIQVDANAIELELYAFGSRSDFRLEAVEASVSEESDEYEDESTTE